jgi:PPOX class probable F420-dependent enzyme
MTSIDDSVRRLLDGPNLAHVATTDAEGHPRVQPTWVGTDGETVWLNSQEGRYWLRRLRRSGRVALSIVNAEDPEEYVEIRGRVVADTHEGAKDHIDELSRTYVGTDYQHHFEGEQRVIFRIAPDRITYVDLKQGVPGTDGAPTDP